MTNATVPTTPSPLVAIVTQLLELNAQKRAEMRKTGANTTYPRTQWFQDYCTVRVGGARQIGHTPAILDLHVRDTVVITYGTGFRESLNRMYSDQMNDRRSLATRVGSFKRNTLTAYDVEKQVEATPRQVVKIELDPNDPDAERTVSHLLAEARDKREKFRAEGPRYDRFIVDMASKVFADRLDLKLFYKWAADRTDVDDPEFIFLG